MTLTDTSPGGLPADPILERRALVQSTARRSLVRRNLVSRLMLCVCGLAFLSASLVLVWIIFLLLKNGLHWISVDFFTQDPGTPTVEFPNAVGGIHNAIVGSIVIDGIALAMAIPIGIIAGHLLAESENRFANAVRTTTEVMTGLPSILFGIFVFEILILKYDFHFSGFLGSIALAVLMVPVIMKASEIAFRAVPLSIREAGLSLGALQARRGHAHHHALGRAGTAHRRPAGGVASRGEDGPAHLGDRRHVHHVVEPLQGPVRRAAEHLQHVLESAIPQQQEFAWGIALFLVTVVLFLNLGSRLTAAFLRRERH